MILASKESCYTQRPNTDFLGPRHIISRRAASFGDNVSASRSVPDEPMDTRFKGVFVVNGERTAAISPGGPIKDLDGNVHRRFVRHPGFPNLFNPVHAALGMPQPLLESGVFRSSTSNRRRA